MNKFFSTILCTFLFFSLLSFKTFALTTELVAENGTEKSYNILFTAPKESSAIQIRAIVSGAEIVNIENYDTGDLSYISTCENGESFSGQEICVDIASTIGAIENDTLLVKVTVNTFPDQEVVFSPNQDHAYLSTDNELITEDGVVLETYNIEKAAEEPAPIVEEATTNENNSLPFVLLIGILVVLVGAFLVIIFLTGKDPQKNIN